MSEVTTRHLLTLLTVCGLLGSAVACVFVGCSLDAGGSIDGDPVGDSSASDSASSGDSSIEPRDDGTDATSADSGSPIDTSGDVIADSASDTTVIDTGTLDTSTLDSGKLDTGTVDTGTVETGKLDTGTVDTGTIDTGTIDTGTVDTAPPDAPDSGVVCTEPNSGIYTANGHCYFVVAGADLDFASAKAACSAKSGGGRTVHLATVTTAGEWSFVNALPGGGANPRWIGLSAAAPSSSKASFGWITGETSTLDKWMSGAPSSAGPCVEQHSSGFSPPGVWEDVPCDGSLAYVCERE